MATAFRFRFWFGVPDFCGNAKNQSVFPEIGNVFVSVRQTFFFVGGGTNIHITDTIKMAVR